MGFKPLPIGVDNFKELIEKGYYYVDKTMLIKELLDMKGKVNLFTRPTTKEEAGNPPHAQMWELQWHRPEKRS